MGFLDFFKSKKVSQTMGTWKELGSYQSIFSNFGTEIYKSDLVRSCIRPLADFTSKATARCSDPAIEKLLNNRPNMYMSGKEFLSKVRTLYELKNNCFIYIQRDQKGHASGFYPVPYTQLEAQQYNGRLFIKFRFKDGETLVLPWADLAVVRKDYCNSDIVGENNNAVLDALSMVNTTNQGLENAIKSTANLRGIIKSTKAMLRDEDIKAQKDRFVNDYMNLANEGGIASLDSTQEFTPISMNPFTANFAQMKEFRENIYRYFGVNDKICMGDMSSDEIEAFYEYKIEPFLGDLSTELTSKVFTDRELSFNNWIVFEGNKLQFASLTKKITYFKEVVLNGGATPNEWREWCNLPPIEGGDQLIRRLDVGNVNDQSQEEEPKEEPSEEPQEEPSADENITNEEGNDASM